MCTHMYVSVYLTQVHSCINSYTFIVYVVYTYNTYLYSLYVYHVCIHTYNIYMYVYWLPMKKNWSSMARTSGHVTFTLKNKIRQYLSSPFISHSFPFYYLSCIGCYQLATISIKLMKISMSPFSHFHFHSFLVIIYLCHHFNIIYFTIYLFCFIFK